MPRSSRIKLGMKDLSFGKFLGGPDKFDTYTGQVWSLVLFSRTNPVLLPDKSDELDKSDARSDMSVRHFQQQSLMTDLSVIC
jgi:hypothetical protein